VPANNNFNDNHVDSLNLWGYKRRQVSLKYFTGDPIQNAGAAGTGSTLTTIKLAATASTVSGFYKGDTIATTSGAGSGQTKTITAYDGLTLVATVDSVWSVTPVVADTHYEITSALDKVLAINVIDDPDHDPPRKIVRYATTTVWWDDKPFKVGKYNRADYKNDPNYDNASPFPPPSVTDPATFLKRRVRAVFINGVFVERMCKFLPPRPLPAS
jgi:hypothetical protein